MKISLGLKRRGPCARSVSVKGKSRGYRRSTRWGGAVEVFRSPPLPSWIWASEVSAHQLPKRRYVQDRFRQGTLQPDVLGCEVPKSLRLGHLHPAVTRPPLVGRGVTDTVCRLPPRGEIIRDWGIDYNATRPRTSLQGLTLMAFPTRSRADHQKTPLTYRCG